LREDLAIIIVAYNRPESLSRLLSSLDQLDYKYEDLTLIISVDNSGDNEVEQIAADYEWRFGSKRVVVANQRLGLKNHVLKCGDMTEEFGNIIVLEDDLIVSPFLVSYADQAIAFYKGCSNIAGISLYSHRRNIINHLPFFAYEDGFDNFFLQIAQSWGQIWSRDRWCSFKKWLASERSRSSGKPIHQYISSWPDSSWLKLHIQYLVAQDLYFVYPRVSLTTNSGDAGSNVISADYSYMVPMMMGNRDYCFSSFLESSSVYDCYFEMTCKNLKKVVGGLDNIDFEVDTYGEKLQTKDTFGLSLVEGLDNKNCFHSIFNQPTRLPIDASLGSVYGLGIINKNRKTGNDNYQTLLKMNYGRLSIRDLCTLFLLKLRKRINRE